VVAGDHPETVVAGCKVRVVRVARVGWHLPLVVLAIELDAKLYLLRCAQAESGVGDLQVASARGQMQIRHSSARQVLPLNRVVSNDLLDAHGRKDFVDGKMTRIDDLDTFSCHEPQFAVGGLCDARAIFASRRRTESDTVGRVPNGHLN